MFVYYFKSQEYYTFFIISLIYLFIFPFPAKAQTIIESAICSNVVELQPVNKKSSFRLGERAYCWLKVEGAKPGTFLTIEWYRGDHLEYKYRLFLKYEIMRTYAYKTLGREGIWKALIKSQEGKILETIMFAVGRAELPYLKTDAVISLKDTSDINDRLDLLYSSLVKDIARHKMTETKKRMIEEIGYWIEHSNDSTDLASQIKVDSINFVAAVYGIALDIDLPNRANKMIDFGIDVDKDHLKFGDIVLFKTTDAAEGNEAFHAGIYLINNFFIQCINERKLKISISNLNESLYSAHFNGGRRVYIFD
jgi:hypothetical protein